MPEGHRWLKTGMLVHAEGLDGADSEDELLRQVPVPAQLGSSLLAPATAAVPLAAGVLGALGAGVRSQAVLFDAAVAPARRAEAALQLLAEVCRGDPRAECVLLWRREQLRGPEFARLARAELGGLEQGEAAGRTATSLPEDALRRVHVKYVLPASPAGGPPPLVRALALLHNLPFAPAAVAVLGLARLARGGGQVPDTIPGGASATHGPPRCSEPRSAGSRVGGRAPGGARGGAAGGRGRPGRAARRPRRPCAALRRGCGGGPPGGGAAGHAGLLLRGRVARAPGRLGPRLRPGGGAVGVVAGAVQRAGCQLGGPLCRASL
ncbi:unnamed protein product [Prorocentrum cordatum]|uniref:Uncharacterized protein n=1 Tax=Prorocentrum cordatum TaxID=2364126 RepID=A0ABN9X6I4_9DINO|nr:unnamed protein product [Polarella glacialis]